MVTEVKAKKIMNIHENEERNESVKVPKCREVYQVYHLMCNADGVELKEDCWSKMEALCYDDVIVKVGK